MGRQYGRARMSRNKGMDGCKEGKGEGGSVGRSGFKYRREWVGSMGMGGRAGTRIWA